MVRSTSLKTYKEIIDEGLLGKDVVTAQYESLYTTYTYTTYRGLIL
jgi:hypothetical protein